MNINRNNYENFFLLYADGELNPIDRQAVDQFVILHPDLKEELDMLLDTVLDIPEDVVMPGKNELLKPAIWKEEQIDFTQEQMLLLLDNELSQAETEKITTEIEHNALLKKEWELLQQTRLTGFAEQMPNKESLYHSERSRRPIPINIIRWVAAAAIVTGLGWYGLSIWNNEYLTGNNGEVAYTIPEKANTQTQSTVPTDVADKTQVETTLANNDQLTKEVAIAQSANTPVQRNAPPQPANQPSSIATELSKQNNQPAELRNLNPVDLSAPAIASIQPKQHIAEPEVAAHIINIENPLEGQLAENQLPDNSLISQAAYHEDPYADDDNEYVTIAGARIKKQKLRGVFRNVTRSITRTFDKSNVAQADVASLK